MTMHVLRKSQASADFLTECENGHFWSTELIGKITQLARKGIIWTSTRCSRAWTVNKPNKSTVVCAVCLLFWHFPHLSTTWKFSRYILCTRMWRPGESFNKEWCKTHENSFFFAMQFLSVASLELDGKRFGHLIPTLALSFALKCSWWKNIQYIG